MTHDASTPQPLAQDQGDPAETVDLEEYAKAGRKPPHAKHYRIRIDKEYIVVDVPSMTGREILALVGKTPEQYMLSQKLHGGRSVPIAADERVDFTAPGIERFQTLALDPTEGETLRRQFDMSEGDVECLEARGQPWETVIESNVRWLVLHDFPIPEGYNHRRATAALRIPPSYPDDQIDMVSFDPPLALAGGRGIGGLSMHPLDGKQFQQWSRHRTPANPWRPGLDDLCAHLLLVEDWLARELRK